MAGDERYVGGKVGEGERGQNQGGQMGRGHNHGGERAGDKSYVRGQGAKSLGKRQMKAMWAGVKLSARPLTLATISLVWAHEIIKAFAHLATVNLLSCKLFISSFNLNPSIYIVDPFYLGALFRKH